MTLSDLTPAQRIRIKHGLYDIYQAIGADAFDGGVPEDDDEFVDVLRDQAGNFPDYINDSDLQAFRALDYAGKRALCLEVGP